MISRRRNSCISKNLEWRSIYIEQSLPNVHLIPCWSHIRVVVICWIFKFLPECCINLHISPLEWSRSQSFLPKLKLRYIIHCFSSKGSKPSLYADFFTNASNWSSISWIFCERWIYRGLRTNLTQSARTLNNLFLVSARIFSLGPLIELFVNLLSALSYAHLPQSELRLFLSRPLSSPPLIVKYNHDVTSIILLHYTI